MKRDYDFIGFSFQPIIDGKPGTVYHSSELGLLRVSDGSRYNEQLLPTIKDKTSEIPGGDGMYYWSSNNTQRNFSVQVAFDSVTESQKRLIGQVFNGKNLGYLVFDEAPYKRYTVKSTGTPQLSFICFEENKQRIYRGSMTLTFIAYYPYAVAPYKVYTDYPTYANRIKSEQQFAASGIMPNNTENPYNLIDQISESGGTYQTRLYNPGDFPTSLKVYFTFNGNNLITLSKIKVVDMGNSITYGELSFSDNISKRGSDDGICIDTDSYLIYGYKNNNGTITQTGNLYNSYISSGDFMKIPIINIIGTNNDPQVHFVASGQTYTKLDYDYIYI